MLRRSINQHYEVYCYMISFRIIVRVVIAKKENTRLPDKQFCIKIISEELEEFIDALNTSGSLLKEYSE